MVSIIGLNIESGHNQTQYSGKQQLYNISIFYLGGPPGLNMRKNKSKVLPLIVM